MRHVILWKPHENILPGGIVYMLCNIFVTEEDTDLARGIGYYE